MLLLICDLIFRAVLLLSIELNFSQMNNKLESIFNVIIFL